MCHIYFSCYRGAVNFPLNKTVLDVCYHNILCKVCVWISPISIALTILWTLVDIFYLSKSRYKQGRCFSFNDVYVFIFCPLYKVHYVHHIFFLVKLKFPATNKCNHLYLQPTSSSDKHQPCGWVHHNIGSVLKLQLIAQNLNFTFSANDLPISRAQ